MTKKLHIQLAIFFCSFVFVKVHAQLTISGQIRTRPEYRNGQGTPQVKDTAAAFFTTQRTRLNIGYSGYRYKIYTCLQDVRVWGQDASTINTISAAANTGFMVHEAWGEISLVDTGKVVKNFTLKIGRQELVYDDQRLLGNLDWLQQARTHDAALLKFNHNGWTAHLSAAFNQNALRNSNIIYNGVPTGYPAGTNGLTSMYKSMQFLYASKELPSGKVSFLAFKDDFSKYHFAATDVKKTTPIYTSGAWSRYTIGGNFLGTVLNKFTVAASAFYQGGQYADGTSLGEHFYSLSVLYNASQKFSFGPGADVFSGNNGADPTKKYQRFDPLYGTPHKFYGYMDYFYAANGFGSNGLINYYLKAKYKPKENLYLTLNAHQFELPNAVTDATGKNLDKALGTEIDLLLNCSITKFINIETGYSMMFSTSTMSSIKVKNVKNAASTSSWAYVMISIRPEFNFKNF